MARKLSPQGRPPVNLPPHFSLKNDCILQASPKSIERSYHNPSPRTAIIGAVTHDPPYLSLQQGNCKQRRKGGTCMMVQALYITGGCCIASNDAGFSGLSLFAFYFSGFTFSTSGLAVLCFQHGIKIGW